MKIKYSPCKHDRNMAIEILLENTLLIDEELYEFDIESVQFTDIASQTDGVIIEAYRDEINELYVIVRRFYTGDCTEWDSGDYHVY